MRSRHRNQGFRVVLPATVNEIDHRSRQPVGFRELALPARDARLDEAVHDCRILVFPEHLQPVEMPGPYAERRELDRLVHVVLEEPAFLLPLDAPVGQDRRHVDAIAEQHRRQDAKHEVGCRWREAHLRRPFPVAKKVRKPDDGRPELVVKPAKVLRQAESAPALHEREQQAFARRVGQQPSVRRRLRENPPGILERKPREPVQAPASRASRRQAFDVTSRSQPRADALELRDGNALAKPRTQQPREIAWTPRVPLERKEIENELLVLGKTFR